jgi:hypothetical protein
LIQTFHRASKIISTAVLGIAAIGGASMALAEFKPSYPGRWVMKDAKPVMSAKAKPYKTVDVVKCGADFCGIPVAADGACGKTLFRFTSKAQEAGDERPGTGKWGKIERKMAVMQYINEDKTPGLSVILSGNDQYPDTREGGLFALDANYNRKGDASCKVTDGKTS